MIFHLGPLALRWYGLAYLAGFAVAWWLGTRRAASGAAGAWTDKDVSDVVFYGALGAVLGGRVGYVLFYGFEQFLDDPLWLFRIWDGGMSFHGGLLGVIAALWWFARRTERTFLAAADFVAPLIPIGLGLGRLGNFVNMELPGRPTEMPWGLIYPCRADAIRQLNPLCTGPWEDFARHPSPLYQAFTEGVVLFVIVWLFAAKPRAVGAVSGVFLLSYGTLRFATEWFRQPDSHLGFLAFEWLTMGQLLSLPMVLFGIVLLGMAGRREQQA